LRAGGQKVNVSSVKKFLWCCRGDSTEWNAVRRERDAGQPVQLNFAETGFITALSQVFNPGDNIQFTETFGGYTLLISADSDNLYGASALGENPFLSLSVQVTNIGGNPAGESSSYRHDDHRTVQYSGLGDRFRQPVHGHF
jgi:hypothetical protein